MPLHPMLSRLVAVQTTASTSSETPARSSARETLLKAVCVFTGPFYLDIDRSSVQLAPMERVALFVGLNAMSYCLDDIQSTHVSNVQGEDRRLCSSDCFVDTRNFECELTSRNKHDHRQII